MRSKLRAGGTHQFSENFRLHTELIIYRVEDGEIVETLDLGENTITNQGRSNMAHLLAGDDTANRIVTTMKLGDAGHNPSDPVEALPTSATDTALFGSEVISKSLSYSFPDGSDANRVTFEAEVASNEANGGGSGQAISEIGLYDTTGRMMTHKTFGLITKTDIFGLLFKYSFLMSILLAILGSGQWMITILKIGGPIGA